MDREISSMEKLDDIETAKRSIVQKISIQQKTITRNTKKKTEK